MLSKLIAMLFELRLIQCGRTLQAGQMINDRVKVGRALSDKLLAKGIF